MIERKCQFSHDRKYRYTLWRDADIFGTKGYVQFICLNPSTADETSDDPTIRRCVAFATKWGFKEFCMTNLFAFRSPFPETMKADPEPVGPDNMDWLQKVAFGADLIVCAWGNHGSHLGQNRKFIMAAHIDWGIKLHVLRVTGAGHPEHPLYIPGDTEPMPFGIHAGLHHPETDL